MRIKPFSIIVLLFSLTVGNVSAQNMVQQPQNLRDGGWPTQNFEDNQMNGWTFRNNDPNHPTTGGSISNATNHTAGGNYSYYLRTGRVCDLISPELTNTENGVRMSFWHTNYNYISQDISSLQIGYSMGNLTEFSWSVLLDIVSDDWQEYIYDFPANVKYIAIRKPGDCTYLFVDDIVFSDADCAAPAIIDYTQTSHSITLEWSGNSDSYNLQYAPFYIHGFNDANAGLGDWTTVPATNSWEWNPDSDYSHSGAGSAISDVNVSQHDNYLVSPLIPFGGSMTFYAEGVFIEGEEGGGNGRIEKAASAQYDFKVMVTTVENPTVDDFTQVGEVMTATQNEWKKYTVDLSGFSGTGHVAFCHIYNAKGRVDDEDEYKLAIDDITVYSPWTIIEDIEVSNYTIENYSGAPLTPETYYAIQVKGGCDKWSNPLNVQTLPEGWSGPYEFINTGDWNIASNWKYGAMPTEGGDVTIKAAARIPAGYVAKVGAITITDNSKLTIADGGQLKHNNTGVKATMEKYITGYSGDKDHYYLLAFPTASNITIGPDNFLNLVHEYVGDVPNDLYEFDQNDELEWINYEPTPPAPGESPLPHPFTKIKNGKGYLYARAEDATLKFVSISNSGGTGLMPSNADVQISLDYTAGNGFAGWNLIGNPYACNAYFADNCSFYRMEETAEGSKIVLATNNVIAPMEGVFVQATGTNQQAVFTSTEPQNNGDGLMDFTLRKANNRSTARIDRTRVVFSEGSNMGHLDLMADPNRLYIPIDDKAMAVVHAQPVGELPLNLEVATEGTFVLGFECRNEDLAYCHLIDNLTGADIDLLQQPEYTFEGRKTDYASRFRVMFATGSSVDGDSFAFINAMGNLSIFGIEGKATVQVIDMLGRVLSSEQFSGSYEKKINVAPGVYVLRLINGEKVMTQKIVIR